MSKELKEKSDKELEKILKETREELRKFRFSQVGSSTRNVKEGQELKNKVAQILTEVNSR